MSEGALPRPAGREAAGGHGHQVVGLPALLSRRHRRRHHGRAHRLGHDGNGGRGAGRGGVAAAAGPRPAVHVAGLTWKEKSNV